MMQIWLPGEFITNSDGDEKFRDFIKANIGNFRRRASKRVKSMIKIPKFSIEYSDDIIEPELKIVYRANMLFLANISIFKLFSTMD